MFDTYHRGPSRIEKTVTEKRAPTDDSVRLLMEMEQAAKEKFEESLIESYRLKDGLLGDIVCNIFKSPSTRTEFDIKCHFKLNGVSHEICIRLEEFDITYHQKTLVEVIYKEVSKELAKIFTERLVEDAYSISKM